MTSCSLNVIHKQYYFLEILKKSFPDLSIRIMSDDLDINIINNNITINSMSINLLIE